MVNTSMQVIGPVTSCFSYGPIIFVILSLFILLIGLWLIDKIDASDNPILYYIIFDICMIICIIIAGYTVYMAVIGCEKLIILD